MEGEKVTLWMIMQVKRWENIELGSVPLVGISKEIRFTPWFGVGFCRVFDTYEEAEKHAGGETIVCVQGKKTAVPE